MNPRDMVIVIMKIKENKPIKCASKYQFVKYTFQIMNTNKRKGCILNMYLKKCYLFLQPENLTCEKICEPPDFVLVKSSR